MNTVKIIPNLMKICICFQKYAMKWTEEHDLMLCREALVLNHGSSLSKAKQEEMSRVK